MFLMGLGFVAMLGLFSTILTAVRSTSDDAQLATQARQVQTYIESENFAYQQCGSVSQYNLAVQAARSAVPPALVLPSSTIVTVTQLQQATGGTHTANGAPGVALSPMSGCGSGPADYGVQQIEFQVTNGKHTIQRISYKRWD